MDYTKFIIATVLINFVTLSYCENKYSKEVNAKYQKTPHKDKIQFVDEPNVNIRNINKPFRMAKLNLLWTKAQSRLTEPKLKSLFSELKVHDKEELNFKKVKAEGKDKDGLLEADMRKRLVGIMSSYGLLEHFDDVSNPQKHRDHEPASGKVKYMNKSLFKDKKLNKLWEKAETSGFTPEELNILRQEFEHHQEKVDQYYSVLNDVQMGDQDATRKNSVDTKLEHLNEIDQAEEGDDITKDYLSKVNQLRDKHREIRDDYDRLYRLAMSGPDSREFVEPKVQGLWNIAIKANFTPDELDSIRVELSHYEKRLLKLRRMHVDAALEEELKKKSKDLDKLSAAEITEDMIKKQTRKVAKLHLDIESRIAARHSEL